MKNLFLLFIVILFCISNCFPQSGWVKKKIGYNYDIFNILHFFNQNTGYAISGYEGVSGYNGRFFKTTNSGQNWTSTNFNNPDHFYKGYFFDDANFVLVGNRGNGFGLVAIYTNNVRNDILIPPVMSGAYETDIAATDWISSDTGFIAGWDFGPGGAQPRALKTLNHGNNWIEITPPINIVSQAIYDLKLDDLKNIYCMGDSKLIKTTNFGQNWNIISSSPSFFTFNIATIDTFYIYDYYFNAKISSDSGHTWQSRSIGNNINRGSLEFLNSKTGWVYGDSGYIYRTNNAGINWVRQNSGTRVSFGTMSIVNENNLWIGGDSGIVLKTTTGGETFIRYEGNTIVNNYKLEQNYPNPFNPTTNFKLHILKTGLIELKIFDITGKLMKTLLKQNLKSGDYTISFDASDFSSGIYFYSLSANGIIIDTKKAVLIK